MSQPTRITPGLTTPIYTRPGASGITPGGVSQSDRVELGSTSMARPTKPNFQKKARGPQGPKRRQGFHGASRATTFGGPQAAIAARYAERADETRILPDLAKKNLAEKEMSSEFPSALLQQVEAMQPITTCPEGVRDMRNMLFFSIDNDDSKDLDQLSYAEKLPNGDIKVWVAIADVDALVPQGSGVDKHAAINTTSVYTSGGVFPMLPRRLSEDLTSLNEGEDRLAMVTEMVIGPGGEVKSGEVYRGFVHNHAKLAYNSVAEWLEGKGPMPERMAATAGVAENVKIHDEAATRLKELRKKNGSLTLESQEAKAKMKDGKLVDIDLHQHNRATQIIENVMVATNGVTARTLKAAGFPTMQRIVKEPKNWLKLVALAKEHGTTLPAKADSAALEKFLEAQRKKDALRFPDLSLEVVKLLGRGEYVVEAPGEKPVGHFGLAVREYSHSTAPNRRYPDLVTQRLLKAAVAGEECPYTKDELNALAERCTEMEGNASKVERQMEKSMAALLLQDRIGETFEAIVSGANEKGTWVRILKPPVEGFLQKAGNARVGQQIDVQLVSTNVEKGFIDFRPV